jgi:hypothetical protein
MTVTPYRLCVFALYQLSIAVAIALFPVALLARQVGVTLPVHRPVERLGTAYDDARGLRADGAGE